MEVEWILDDESHEEICLLFLIHSSLGKRYINSPCIHFSSSINGGLFFHYYTNGLNHTHSGFEIKFSRKSEDKFSIRIFIIIRDRTETRSRTKISVIEFDMVDGGGSRPSYRRALSSFKIVVF
uniref:CUB domain-containing protein n=1 Tax=Meloidogyne incognita TaxID=6306 RepID=A0A914M442_MELIC